MAQRTRQFNNDEDLPINNYRITGIKSLLFNEMAAGTVPVASEVLYADGVHQAFGLWVRDYLRVGDDNQAVLHQQAASESIDTRGRTFAYTGGRLTGITEKDGSTTVKDTVNTLDGYGRVTQSQTIIGGKTITTTYTYDGNSERIASMSRVVV